MIHLCLGLTSRTRREAAHFPSAEVGGLVHVDPHAVKWQLVMEVLQECLPVLGSLGIQKIWIMRCSWPHLCKTSAAPMESQWCTKSYAIMLSKC